MYVRTYFPEDGRRQHMNMNIFFSTQSTVQKSLSLCGARSGLVFNMRRRGRGESERELEIACAIATVNPLFSSLLLSSSRGICWWYLKWKTFLPRHWVGKKGRRGRRREGKRPTIFPFPLSFRVPGQGREWRQKLAIYVLLVSTHVTVERRLPRLIELVLFNEKNIILIHNAGGIGIGLGDYSKSQNANRIDIF